VDVEAGGGGVVDCGEQDGVFGGEPCQGLLAVGGMFRGGPGLGWRECDRVAGGVQYPVGGVSGVQVVIERPMYRLMPFVVRVMGVGEFAGVDA
jgi:hypothetical protein